MGNLNVDVSVVTGASGGLGLEISTALARAGGTVVMVVREAARGEVAAEAIRSATGNGKVEVVAADFSSLASTRTAAETLRTRHPKLKLLVNNAAVYSNRHRTTSDGFELMLEVNHLAPLLFTQLLVGALKAGAPSRVVFMTMETQEPIALDDLNSQRRKFTAFKQFGMSKAASQYTTVELAQRLAGSGVTVNAVHPGLVKSRLPREAAFPLRALFALFGQSKHQGARGPIWVATAPELADVTGQFFVKTRKARFPGSVLDSSFRGEFWRESAKLVGATP